MTPQVRESPLPASAPIPGALNIMGDREVSEILYALNAFSIVAITDRRGRILHVNDQFCEISKYSREELIGQDHRIINSGKHPKEFFKKMWRVIGRGGVWKDEICNRAKDGSEYWVDTTIIPLLDDRGRPERYVAIRTEETQRHLVEEQARRLAYFDAVTEMPNRASMLHAISDLAGKSHRDVFHAFVCLSVDELSVVNDAFGYEVGDRLIVDSARRLRTLGLRAEAIGRIGTDSFGILLTGLGTDPAAANTRCAELIEEVFSGLAESADLGDGVVLEISTSLGYVLWTAPEVGTGTGEDGTDPPCGDAPDFIQTADAYEVLKCAEIARKRARLAGGQRRSRLFKQSMPAEARERVRLISELRRGIGHDELRLYSQPIVDAQRRIIGEEGLIRWLSPERGLVPPNDFIPLAEQTGIIVEIGDWVILEACRILRHWSRDPMLKDLTFSVNLSERQLRVDDFGERVRQMLIAHEVPPGRLKFELTESVLHTDLDRTIRLLTALRADGVLSSLDDFGTGYSSLSYLRQLPVQQLKIDRSFVSSVVEDPQAAAIAQSIVQLGGTFGLQIVAEGVETEAQFETLRELGVDAFQGYLFSRPRPVAEVLLGP